jgi:hypothetical protein
MLKHNLRNVSQSRTVISDGSRMLPCSQEKDAQDDDNRLPVVVARGEDRDDHGPVDRDQEPADQRGAPVPAAGYSIKQCATDFMK